MAPPFNEIKFDSFINNISINNINTNTTFLCIIYEQQWPRS